MEIKPLIIFRIGHNENCLTKRSLNIVMEINLIGRFLFAPPIINLIDWQSFSKALDKKTIWNTLPYFRE
jgi:hypothetical protein